MSADMTSEQMQAKITAARREAEGLKDRIKRKKDDLADTSCEYYSWVAAKAPP
jgi:guanine nucleotide-binding protein G(I)/G(S)/G(T) subunit beta-1